MEIEIKNVTEYTRDFLRMFLCVSPSKPVDSAGRIKHYSEEELERVVNNYMLDYQVLEFKYSPFDLLFRGYFSPSKQSISIDIDCEDDLATELLFCTTLEEAKELMKRKIKEWIPVLETWFLTKR